MGSVDVSKDYIYKFRRKYNQVEGVRVTSDNVKDVAKWCGGDVVGQIQKDRYIKSHDVLLKVPTLSEPLEVYEGEWLLKNEEGKFLVMDNRDFIIEYEHVKPTDRK